MARRRAVLAALVGAVATAWAEVAGWEAVAMVVAAAHEGKAGATELVEGVAKVAEAVAELAEVAVVAASDLAVAEPTADARAVYSSPPSS